MAPTGLNNTVSELFGHGYEPAKGSSDPRSLDENTPVIQIIGRSDAHRRLRDLLQSKSMKASVFLADRGSLPKNQPIISVTCEFPEGQKINRLVMMAAPGIEIRGSNRMPAKCRFIGIDVDRDGRFLEIKFQTLPGYDLNLKEGSEHSLPAVWFVVVDTDHGRVELLNSKLDPKTHLRTKL